MKISNSDPFLLSGFYTRMSNPKPFLYYKKRAAFGSFGSNAATVDHPRRWGRLHRCRLSEEPLPAVKKTPNLSNLTFCTIQSSISSITSYRNPIYILTDLTPHTTRHGYRIYMMYMAMICDIRLWSMISIFNLLIIIVKKYHRLFQPAKLFFQLEAYLFGWWTACHLPKSRKKDPPPLLPSSIQNKILSFFWVAAFPVFAVHVCHLHLT